MTTPVIEARGLRKNYGATIAVDGVDLRVEEGRILGTIQRFFGLDTQQAAVSGLPA